MHHVGHAAYHPAMLTKLRPWLPCIALAAVAVLPLTAVSCRPDKPSAADPSSAALPSPTGGEPDRDKLIADCTETIRLHPEDAGAYYRRATAYKAAGSLDKAIADFGEAIWLGQKSSADAAEALGGVDGAGLPGPGPLPR